MQLLFMPIQPWLRRGWVGLPSEIWTLCAPITGGGSNETRTAMRATDTDMPTVAAGDPPLVRILMSNHNYGRFVGHAVDSALSQTYSHLEVVVGYDGPTDDSPKVLAGFGDRITVIHLDHRGFVQTIQTGVEAANGRFVCLLDADDKFATTKVERVAWLFVADPSLTRVSNDQGASGLAAYASNA
jgi:cellulose synthase/poly-beta-1,6-N-acetylglucosamine synthase-like glycosyltransferase